MTSGKKHIKVISVCLVAILLAFLGWAYYFWRFEIMGRTDHKVRFLNMPTHDGNPLTLIIEDGARNDRVIYKGEFLESIILRDIQYCEKSIQGATVRSYEETIDPEAQMSFGSFQFIIFDPKARVIHRVFGEAPGPIYSASEATVELYPFVREDVLGRYAVRIDTPLHQLPEWYQNPRLYSDPF
jgi:hypothetical protein